MERLEQLEVLNRLLLNDMPEYRQPAERFPHTAEDQRRLLRSLMNLRPPKPLDPEFLRLQDELLSAEREEKGVVDVMSLPTTEDSRVILWQGDITRLKVDAIVNAANRALLGCFSPCHGCIDNAIHSAAGLQLREECHRIMEAQGQPEPAGRAKLTKGYHLPARYVLHTVGPIIQGQVTAYDREQLAACYRSCLELTVEHGLKSVAFCCISTGEFHFPNQEAAEIAIGTVMEFLKENTSVNKVVFNVFRDVDRVIYQDLLAV